MAAVFIVIESVCLLVSSTSNITTNQADPWVKIYLLTNCLVASRISYNTPLNHSAYCKSSTGTLLCAIYRRSLMPFTLISLGYQITDELRIIPNFESPEIVVSSLSKQAIQLGKSLLFVSDGSTLIRFKISSSGLFSRMSSEISTVFFLILKSNRSTSPEIMTITSSILIQWSTPNGF